MGKRIADDLDRRRGQPPRNGVHLSGEAQHHVFELVNSLVDRLHLVASQMRSARRERGNRAWRRDCLTAEQRARLKDGARRVRAEAKKWVR